MSFNQYLLLLFTFLEFSAQGQTAQNVIENLPFRSIGPAFMTGRISDVAKDPTHPSTWYVATASSNVWKTQDRGTTWQPIFDNYGSFSTGCITLDPNNPLTIWLGTGENQSQRSAGWGDGIYKSIDGGASWINMGLEESEHIGKIVVDPRNSEVIHVAAQGPLWNDGGDRGVYKSADGGKSWKKTLDISPMTGASEILLDPRNPDIMYANTYQRRRHVGILVAGGPESRIYKSTDAGETWFMLSNGLPTGDVGRIAMAISPQKSNVLYAMIAATKRKSGFYKSTDAGASWRKINDYVITDPQYYGEIYADPHRFDCVYVMDVMIHVTEDGGKNFRRLNSNNKHVDNHSLLFDEGDPEYLMIGCDGGIYESWNRGETWTYHSNLPIMQFYRVGIDNEKPFYNVYGGTQDNSTIMGPSQTNTRHGVTNRDWKLVLGGDGFQARIDPSDPNTVYAQSQYAGIVRYDRQTGQRTELQPQVGVDAEPLRWHWDSPLLISHHNPQRIYFAAQNIFRSDDRGDSWHSISSDLSRGEDRNQREVMGEIWPPEAVWKNVFTSPHGTIVALSESTLQDGLLIAGTDDGLIQVTEDGGNTWKKLDVIQGIPKKAYVADVFASQHDAKTFYGVFNNHKEGDFKPYIVKTTDLGNTWQILSKELPGKHACWSIYEDFEEPNLLFLGTEFGIWSSVNGGENWTQMKGNFPTVAVRDIEIQNDESDLILATFGRGFYILDDYSVLRSLAGSSIKESSLLHVPNAKNYFLKGDLGYRKKGVFGDNYYTADNPGHGAIFDLYLEAKIKSVYEDRASDEKYPSYETLRNEDVARNPEVFIQIKNTQNEPQLVIPVKNKKGFQRIHHTLRKSYQSSNGKISRQGPTLPDGKYQAQLMSLKNQNLTALGQAFEFKYEYLPFSKEKADPQYFDFYDQVTKLLVQTEELQESVELKLEENSAAIQMAKLQGNSSRLAALEETRLSLRDTQYRLQGDETRRKRFQYYLPGLVSRLRNVYRNQFSSAQITNTHRNTLALVETEIDKLMAALK